MFAYAANNPVRYIDPTGRNSEDDLASELGNTTKSKGVDLNLFSNNREQDIVDKTSTNKNIYMRDVADNVKRYNSLFYVSGHGSRDIVSSCGTDGNEEKSYLQPEQLAKLIKENPNYKGQPVVLLVCNNGNDPNNDENSIDCYAQRLANALGENSIVIASEGYVDYKTGVMIQTRPNGREITCRTYSVDPGKQHLFRGVKK